MPCDDDLQEEEDLKEQKVQEYNARIYADFYGDAIEDIKREMESLPEVSCKGIRNERNQRKGRTISETN